MATRRITKIEADRKAIKKTRVAAYCRVSTLIDGQQSSLENQKAHYLSLIGKHQNWEFAGLYYEEGVSGTKKEIRPELKRMMADCRNGKIDLILTKSISRFARNTSDCLEMVRALTNMGIHIIFEKENVDTRRLESEFILTILSSLAEEESHSISENEKWSIQKRFQDGTYRFKKAPYGYRWDDGKFLIDPVDSEILKWMFDKILEGKGTSWIAKELNKAGIPSRRNMDWSSGVVRQIVRNPACMGDVLMCKTYKDKNFHVIRNLGEKPKYYMDHHHEPIINAETFRLAQEAITQRGKEKGVKALSPAERARHQSPQAKRYPMTGKIICGGCGNPMHRAIQYSPSGRRIRWKCRVHVEDKTVCPMKSVLDDNIRNAFLTMINKLRYAPFILDWYGEQLSSRRMKEVEKRMEEIRVELQKNTAKRHRLAQLATSGCVEPVSFQQEVIRLQEEAAELKNERFSLMGSSENPAIELRHFLAARNGAECFSEQDFTNFVENVTVHSPTCFTFHLKCGLALTEGEMPEERKEKT